MRANKPHKGYRRLRALGSGTWDKASRRVMPPLYPKAAYRSSLGHEDKEEQAPHCLKYT